MLKIKTIKKRIKLEYPTYVNRVLEILNEKLYKTDELSKKSKIGGAKLKEVLDLLINEGKVEKSTLSEGRGRPAAYYSLIDDK